ncbi:hypothetical protein MYP_2452 [Sporocytophaga myxococcoides]|uniref:Uncharacterized protein n=1 Tax=Sporocytophaga myxococcoides TaxID=153721 RepID=A0A098LGL0_9BACT|nr:hypothetical protein MYP_2452 [Sporocytophaga myxococcoides]
MFGSGASGVMAFTNIIINSACFQIFPKKTIFFQIVKVFKPLFLMKVLKKVTLDAYSIQRFNRVIGRLLKLKL